MGEHGYFCSPGNSVLGKYRLDARDTSVIRRAVATLTPVHHEGLHVAKTERWKQQLVCGVLVLSDVLLLIRGVAYIKSIWGHGPLTDIAVANIVPVIPAWVCMCTLGHKFVPSGIHAGGRRF